MTKEEKIKEFEMVLGSFENPDIKEFAEIAIGNLPDYFFEEPASTSGRYHPTTSLGVGGLKRHTLALVRFMNFMFEVESFKEKFTSRERDLCRIAGILHDGDKHRKINGEIADYTTFEHPVVMADKVREYKQIPYVRIMNEEIDFIADCISSHMGAWNTSTKSDIVLPKPTTNYQILVHMCDYLASRKDINMTFEDYIKPTPPDVDFYQIDFGKYKGTGKTLKDIQKIDPQYIQWLKENYGKEPVRTMLQQL